MSRPLRVGVIWPRHCHRGSFLVRRFLATLPPRCVIVTCGNNWPAITLRTACTRLGIVCEHVGPPRQSTFRAALLARIEVAAECDHLFVFDGAGGRRLDAVRRARKRGILVTVVTSSLQVGHQLVR